MVTAITPAQSDRMRRVSANIDRTTSAPRFDFQDCCSEPVPESRHLQPLVIITALNAVILGIALNCPYSASAPLAVFVLLATAQTAACYWILLQVHADHAVQERLMARLIVSREDVLSRTREAFFVGLSHLAKSRDQDTDGHVERVGQNATVLAAAARQHPKFAIQIDDEFIRLIGVSSALHDIGKVGIADSVLNKPGALTASEREHMQGHTHISR